MFKHAFIWLLSSTLLIRMAAAAPETLGSIERLDASLDQLIVPDAVIEKLASGFTWSEGPVWKEDGLLFSDVPANTAFVWKEGKTAAEIFLKPSGCSGDPAGQGSNGLALDAQGALILCQHGDRRVARLEKGGAFTSLADRFEGKRFNSPNDLAIARNGVIYFTDPPYGLKKGGAAAELDFHGVYALQPGGKISLLIRDLRFPNGIALSPDERILYIAVSDPQNTRVMAYDLEGGVAVRGREFFNAQSLKSAERKGGCDGLKVDARGNVWTSGPGGVLVLDKNGKHLGTILTGQATANCAFGGADRQTLYITAHALLLRVRTLVKGL